MGVVHGVRLFTPMMLEAAAKDPALPGPIVNTASMAGLLTPPNMGVYNVTKPRSSPHRNALPGPGLVTDQVGAPCCARTSCPPASREQRNRPASCRREPTKSQLIGQAMSDKAVSSGKVSAAEVAQ